MQDDATQEFGTLIRSRRHAKSLSQEALAAAAFGNADRKTYVSALENGRLKRITPATAAKLAKALEIHREEVPSDLRWEVAGSASPLETRMGVLEARVSAQGDAPNIAELFNAQVAHTLDVSIADLYFQRLERGLQTLTHWVGDPFSLRSLAVSFTLAFVYVVFAGLFALGQGAQSIGEITPFGSPLLSQPGLVLSLSLICALILTGVVCWWLLRVLSDATASVGLRAVRIGLAATVAGLTCTFLAELTGEPITIALFFAVLCLGPLGRLSPGHAALAGLGGGVLAGGALASRRKTMF